MENDTKNIWSDCEGRRGFDCPCLNFVWKKPNRNVIYTEENLTEEFSQNYNSKSLVTILDPIQYTIDGTQSCVASLGGSQCIPNNNCSTRPGGITICNKLFMPPNTLPELKITYSLEYYKFNYKKCKLSPKRCLCPPHSKDHYCFTYTSFKRYMGKNFKEFAEQIAKDKNNGNFQLGVHINLKYPKNIRYFRDCNIRSKYSGIVMKDPPPLPSPWSQQPRQNCNQITSAGVQGPRTRCGELNFHLGAVRFVKGKPPAGTPPFIGPVRVPFM